MREREQSNFAQTLPRGEAIAQLNDKLRKGASAGRIALTRGVHMLPGYDARELMKALGDYDCFDGDNDPHGERDFGDLELFGETLFWKIDYYDRALEFVSPDPADPNVTIRVLTVMLESEY